MKNIASISFLTAAVAVSYRNKSDHRERVFHDRAVARAVCGDVAAFLNLNFAKNAPDDTIFSEARKEFLTSLKGRLRRSLSL